MEFKQQDRVAIPNFLPMGQTMPWFFVIDKDWSNKDSGFGPFYGMAEASTVAVEYNSARAHDNRKQTYPARVVRVDPTGGRRKAIKVLNAAPRHQPVGHYSEVEVW